MDINKDYILRVLKSGGFGGAIVGNYVVLDDKTPQGWTIKMDHYPGAISISVWIEKPAPDPSAWVEVSLPLPSEPNAYLSKLIRWAAEVITTADVLPFPKRLKKVIDEQLREA